MGPLDTLARPLKVPAPPAEVVGKVHDAFARLGVDMPVRLWDGTQLGAERSTFRLVLCHPWSLRAMLGPRTDLAAGEAYLFEDVDVEGSLIDALHTVAVLKQAGLGRWERAGLARLLLSLPAPPERNASARAHLQGRRHSKTRDREAIRYHYDVGNDFYRLFLDEQLVYSCAYFSDDDPTDPTVEPSALERAQVRKLDLVCRKLRLRPGLRLLDIGCGWGSLLLHAARHYGVAAVGVTTSREQAALARERIGRARLDDRVEVRVEDYRDVRETFDAVASIGMFEHVGENRFVEYFERAAELTAPGGLFLNHAITTGRRQRVRRLTADSGTFIGSYVFPDGTLAPAHMAVRLLEGAGFELLDVHQLRPHYARTLRHWVRNLERNADRARTVAGERVYRTWRAYMAGSVVGFERGDLGVVQVLGGMRQSAVPLGRSWMEPLRP